MAQIVTETSSAQQTGTEAAKSATKVSALRRLHHHAFAVEDQEVTRQYMEDILGIPLTATWCERSERGVAETDQAGQDAIHKRLLDAGIQHHIINHGYVTSLYVTSPDGLLFEVCVDPEFVDEIREIRIASAHDDLKRWLGGDFTLNNQWRGTPPQIFPGRSRYDPPTK